MSLPFVDLKAQYRLLKSDIDGRIQRVLDSGSFILGPEVAELEGELARWAGVKHAIGVANGTDALQIALMVEGIGPGDAVFLPSFTYAATAEAAVLVGATPVFVDVDAGTFNVDPDDLDARIAAVAKAGKLRPKALIAVDLFGQAADYKRLAPLMERHGLRLVADAAQSFGGKLDGKAVGALAPITTTSFYPSKPLGCYGDGGAILTDDPAKAELVRSIRFHGTNTADRYDMARIGMNSRLDTIQAAVLLAKLKVFARELETRERVARLYDSRLGNLVAIPARAPNATSSWAQYTIQVDNRDQVAAKLKAAGIPTAVYYQRPLHLQTAYRGHGQGAGSLPVSEAVANRVLSLPIHGYLDDATAQRVCDAVAAAVGS
jgi:dTDP-4-amino-4,6-dideoxygalactose transaminase